MLLPPNRARARIWRTEGEADELGGQVAMPRVNVGSEGPRGPPLDCFPTIRCVCVCRYRQSALEDRALHIDCMLVDAVERIPSVV